MSDLDQLRELTSQFQPPPFDDIVAVSGSRRRRSALSAGAAAAAVVVVVITAVAAGVASRPGTQLEPTRPATSQTPTPTERGSEAADQPGLIRQGEFPVLTQVQAGLLDPYADAYVDPRDTAVAEIDIRSVRPVWMFNLAARPPRDPAQRIIAYGVVIDADGDQEADCQIGVSNDASRRGDFYGWITNLRTGKTEVDDGPPYGRAMDFVHPDDEDARDMPPQLQFVLGTGNPCDPNGDSAAFYAWSSVTEDGQVTAWDYAPDAAWLPMCPGDMC